MKHYVFKQKDSYKTCFLVNKIQADVIEKEYLCNLDKEDVLILDLYKEPKKKKTSASLMKEYFQEVKEVLNDFKVEYVCICNADYYKTITKAKKADVKIGYVDQIDQWKMLYVPDFASIFYDPEKVRCKIQRSIQALKDAIAGIYKAPGSLQFKSWYPSPQQEIYQALKAYLEVPVLTCDIETYSLKPHLAGIGSIGFAKNEHEGIAFRVDPSKDVKNYAVRNLLKAFFCQYKGKLIFHNIAFDATVLIYQLFMTDIADTEGLLTGLNIMLRNFDDTKLIAYLATNTCAGNELGLKALAQEFAGNYAQEEIEDISKIPEPKLLEYNLVDCLSTWYVYHKYYPIMQKDQQENLYKSLFIPSTVDIVHMQLTGLPLNIPRVLEVEKILLNDQQQALKSLNQSSFIDLLMQVLKQNWVEAKNAKLKKKKVTIDDADVIFNPRSHQQIQIFLYSILNLPVIDKTESGQAATGTDTLEALKNHTSDPEKLKVLQALIDFYSVDKILTSFIPAFKEAPYSKLMNWHFLIGSFNLGGTVSGRLSSSDPNLQNLPATGSKYAKIIKSCFQAPKGWLLCGLDFESLEDHISALTTKDKNKLKVYIDHFNGHCLRAYAYFKDKMPDITQELKLHPEDEVKIINSIKDRYKSLRQRSKAPTFALTYQGTWSTLVKNCGFTEEEAKHIEKQYHELYKASDQWVQDKLNQASKDGYVTCAFGLRVRTPLLKQVVRHTAKTPYEAEAEGRTAGNALGQSWCLLNNRAGVEFNSKVRNSRFRTEIKPCAQIHDAQYFLIKDDGDTIIWAKENLVKAVSWQDDPVIYHPEVKLGGEFSIFFPDWAHECVIPNNVTNVDQLANIIKDYLKSLSSN